MPEQLLKFDAFGLVRVDRSKVTTTITAVTSKGKPINRTLTEEVAEIIEIEPDEFASFVFGACLEPGKRSRVAIREISNIRSNADVEAKPQVRKAIEDALDFIRTKTR